MLYLFFQKQRVAFRHFKIVVIKLYGSHMVIKVDLVYRIPFLEVGGDRLWIARVSDKHSALGAVRRRDGVKSFTLARRFDLGAHSVKLPKRHE